MNPLWIVCIEFALSAAAIGVAGVKLSQYGDALATATGLSRNWVGLVLMATVTSLPELVTGLSSVTMAAAPDIAVGDVLGSCIFNLTILAMVDVTYRKDSIYAVAGRTHIVSAGFGVILMSTVALAMLLSAQGMIPVIAHVSFASVLIVAIYLVAMRALYRTEQRNTNESTEVSGQTKDGGSAMSLKTALMGYGAASTVIVAAGIALPMIGVELASLMGWSNSFVGTLFVAFATSVPELATTWGAIRIGAVDMSFGNLLGSNLFDIVILAIDDFAYLKGSIFSNVAPVHAVSAMSASLMSGIVIIALAYRPVSRVWHIASWAGLSLLVLYVVNSIIQYSNGH
jgi:cation:H+ antiporter